MHEQNWDLSVRGALSPDTYFFVSNPLHHQIVAIFSSKIMLLVGVACISGYFGSRKSVAYFLCSNREENE